MRQRVSHKGAVMFLLPWGRVLMAALSLLLLSAPAAAAKAVGTVTVTEGKVEVLRAGKLPARPVKPGDPLYVGDLIRTKSGARAVIVFGDGNRLNVAQRTRLAIREYVSAKGVITLPVGTVEAVVRKRSSPAAAAAKGRNRFEINTPNAIAGVRGTDFFVSHSGGTTSVVVKEGSVYTYNLSLPREHVAVTAGSMTVVEAERPPQQPRHVERSEMDRYEREVKPERAKSGTPHPALQRTSSQGKASVSKQPSAVKSRLSHTKSAAKSSMKQSGAMKVKTQPESVRTSKVSAPTASARAAAKGGPPAKGTVHPPGGQRTARPDKTTPSVKATQAPAGRLGMSQQRPGRTMPLSAVNPSVAGPAAPAGLAAAPRAAGPSAPTPSPALPAPRFNPPSPRHGPPKTVAPPNGRIPTAPAETIGTNRKPKKTT